jgi:hypothetical protein
MLGGTKIKFEHQLLVYADDVNLLGCKIDTTRNIETLTDASMEIGLEVKAEETNYMLLFLYQNVGKIYDIKLANRSTENVVQFKYFGNNNIKSTFYSGGD